MNYLTEGDADDLAFRELVGEVEHDDRAPFPARQLQDGREFILDAPTHVPALWGDGQDVLWQPASR
jgi:hypothetical protein